MASNNNKGVDNKSQSETIDSTAGNQLSDREKRIAEKTYVTGRIGETCRYIGFGALATFYAVATGESDFTKRIMDLYPNKLSLLAIAGAGTIIFDYFQYLFGEYSVRKALNRPDGKNLYDSDWISYKLKNLFYRLKQVSAFVASCIVFYISFMALR